MVVDQPFRRPQLALRRLLMKKHLALLEISPLECVPLVAMGMSE